MPRSATSNVDVDTGVLTGIAGPRKRIYRDDDFNKIPNLVAAYDLDGSYDNADSEALAESNHDWILAGTDAAIADITHNTSGGINLKTNAGGTDQAILIPNTSALVDTGLSNILWDTGKRPAVEWCFTTENAVAGISSMTAWCGFKLAAGAVVDPYNVTTDNDSVVVEYVAGVNSGNFMIRYSTDTADGSTVVDYSIDTGIAVAINTTYVVKIALDSDRVAWVNIADAADLGAAVEIPTKYALKDVTTLIPTIGVQDGTTAAKQIAVHYVALGRDRGVGDPL